MKKIQKAVLLVTPASCDDQNNDQSEQSSLDISPQAYDRARSLSDSGFESRDSVKAKFRKFSVAPAIEKQKLAEARKVRFKELAAERRNASINLSERFEIPEAKFSNFTNIFGRKIKKKVFKQEKVTLQSFMSRSWKDIVDNIDDS